MAAFYDVDVSACDPLNLGFGYQMRVTRSHDGSTVLFTSKDPATGQDLLTLEDCLRVASWYTRPPYDMAGRSA